MKALGTLLRALTVVTRDTFSGFVIGLSGAVLLVHFFDYTVTVAALAMPVGMGSGFLKGLTKFFIFNYFSAIPTKGYRFYYPKYKLLAFWGSILFVSMLFSYGFDIRAWYLEPIKLIDANKFLGPAGKNVLLYLFWSIIVIGIFSHLYEPPYDEFEQLPPDFGEEQEFEQDNNE